MKSENISIEEVILNVSKRIVNKRKTKITFYIVSFIFSFIAFMFAPEFRTILNSNSEDSSLALMLMCGVVSVAGICLWLTLLPVAFNFKPKSKELIAVIDKALSVYITEMRLTRYRYKNTLDLLKEKPNKSAEIQKKMVEIERSYDRINEHLKVVDEKSETIKEKTVQLALAS